MRFFNSGLSSSYIIVSPKEKDKIELVESNTNFKEVVQKEGKIGGELSKENIKFLKILKSGSGFKRI